MEPTKVKLLSNYQLFQLAQNELLDTETLTKARKELEHRNIATIELKKLQQQHEAAFEATKKQMNTTFWNPLYTSFAWKKHFVHLAMLKTHGRAREARSYRIRFYLGIAIYMLLLICALLLSKT